MDQPGSSQPSNFKRKLVEEANEPVSRPSKKARGPDNMSEQGVEHRSHWPEYFEEVKQLATSIETFLIPYSFSRRARTISTGHRSLTTTNKTFKALNTVLAFCSSRKHLATTFSVIRKSAESLLKRPIDLKDVAEVKAVIPDLLRFGYIPADQVRLNSSEDQQGKKRASSPTYALPSASIVDDEDHVLVFEFIESTKKYKSAELIEACPRDGADGPVELVKQAARYHIPVKAKGDVQQSLVMKNSERPPMTEIIEELRREDWYRDQIVEHRSLPRKVPLIGELAVPLPENVVEALQKSRGISKLYKHQADAINAVKDGKHVIVCTATASGKSVIYQVPALLFLEEDNDSTAIYIYPTKALAQDQRLALDQLVHACPGLEDIKVSTYDGDTPKEKRPQIRESASVIFTNFDMLHASILPQEDKWRRFLKNLKIVAVDELHYYSGPLGSHVAQIMRRLRRVCAAVGNRHVRYVS
ncbi:hypothetical protein FRC19_011653, partial [Serendipita sp. 401]